MTRRTLGWGLGLATGALVLLSVLPFACAGPPGAFRPGETWVVVRESPYGPLRKGVVVATWRLDAEISPPALERHLRVDGADVAVGSVADVRPYIRPIRSADAAKAYTSLLRLLEIPRAEVPGFGGATPDEGGLSPLFAERVAALGVDPWPEVSTTETGFAIVRPMVRVGPGGDRLVLLRETITEDGGYAFEELQVLAEGKDAYGLIFRAR